MLRRWIRLGQVSVHPLKKILRFITSLCRWIINDFRFSCFLHCKLDLSPHLSENKVNLTHALKSTKIRSAQERHKSAWEGSSNYMITLLYCNGACSWRNNKKWYNIMFWSPEVQSYSSGLPGILDFKGQSCILVECPIAFSTGMSMVPFLGRNLFFWVLSWVDSRVSLHKT